jgi:hypothetical protein
LLMEATRAKGGLKLVAMALCGVHPLCNAVLGGKGSLVSLGGVVVFRH